MGHRVIHNVGKESWVRLSGMSLEAPKPRREGGLGDRLGGPRWFEVKTT